MKNNIYQFIYLPLTILLLHSCSQETEPVSINNQNDISTTEQQEVKMSQTKDSVLSMIGTIEVSPEAVAHVYSPMNGIIKMLHVREGQFVKKGQKLASLEHQDVIKLQENYLKSKADFELFEKEYLRKKPLYESDMISEKEFLESQNKFTTSRAQFESYKNQLDLLGISRNQIENGSLSSTLILNSPINGFVTHISANTGTHTLQDVKLFEIIDDTERFLRLKVFSDDIGRIKLGQSVQFNFGEDTVNYKGKVDRIGRMVDLSDKSVDVFVELDNPTERLVVGSTIFARIKL